MIGAEDLELMRRLLKYRPQKRLVDLCAGTLGLDFYDSVSDLARL